MAKESKCKLLFIAVFLAMLLSSSAYASLVPNVHAAEATPQEKGLSILNNVVGLDLSKYVTSSKECLQDSYLDVVPQENMRYTLKSNGSNVDMLFTFANGNLRMIHVLESEGAPRLTKIAANTLEMAKGFLRNYQSYSGNSFYGELGLMLNEIDTGENLTKTSGNIKLEATDAEDYETFRWIYTYNGVEAPSKCVVLGYRNGFLKYFVDNWNLYQIGSTSVNLSENEAIDMALARSRTFSWKMGSGNSTFEVKNFTVAQAMLMETVFSNFIDADEARNHDPFTLYPTRCVWVSLDKFYPGNVYGIEVYIWADTGEISGINERFSTLDPPTDQIAKPDDFIIELADSKDSFVNAAEFNATAISWVLAAAVLATVPAWFMFGKKKNLLGSRFFKLGGILFCLLISTMLLVPISTASATSNYRAVVWGAESTGGYDEDMPGSWKYWRKTQGEIERQQAVSYYIFNRFNGCGYDASNYQGSGSIKAQILNNISYSEANYARVAVVDFDHGIGRTDYSKAPNEWHYMFEDNIGTMIGIHDNYTEAPENGVYDVDVYDETYLGKTFFAFINTCLSACINDTITNSTGHTVVTGLPYGGGNHSGTGNPVGMPYAWTHRTVGNRDIQGFTKTLNMSDNGYLKPDSGAFCYIGCPWGSAALNQALTMYQYTIEYGVWVIKFFEFALEDEEDFSVKQAMDEASLYYFTEPFYETLLNTGFNATWPMWNGEEWSNTTYPNSRLVVYGNGNIHLLNPPADVGIWHLNEESGSTASDSSPFGNHGTVYGGASWTSGIIGNALSFDGANDYVNVPHDDSISGLRQVTLTLWVKLDALPPSHSVNLAGVASEYWLEYRDSGYLSLSTYINGNYDGQGFSVNLADGDWHMLALTYDGTYKKGYLDGEPEATIQISGTLDDTNNAFQIGASFPASQGYNGCPDGVIDEVHVYDRALSADEVASLYAVPVTVLCYNQYEVPGYNIPVYIDDEYAGVTFSTFNVKPGNHKIQMPDDIYDALGYHEFWYYEYDAVQNSSNPMTIAVNSDKTIYAIYYSYYW